MMRAGLLALVLAFAGCAGATASPAAVPVQAVPTTAPVFAAVLPDLPAARPPGLVAPAVLVSFTTADVPELRAPTVPAAAAHCAEPRDRVERAFEAAFRGRHGCAVDVIRCEGWNATANFDIGHVSDSGDIGPAQINQIHASGILADRGGWPDGAATLELNIKAALELHDQAGWQPWANSRHCHGQR
jgi:hypothetical protein